MPSVFIEVQRSLARAWTSLTNSRCSVLPLIVSHTFVTNSRSDMAHAPRGSEESLIIAAPEHNQFALAEHNDRRHCQRSYPLLGAQIMQKLLVVSTPEQKMQIINMLETLYETVDKDVLQYNTGMFRKFIINRFL